MTRRHDDLGSTLPTMNSPFWRYALACLAMNIVGCEEERPPSARGAEQRGGGVYGQAQSDQPAEDEEDVEEEAPLAPSTPSAAAEEEVPEEPEDRDLDGEFRAALGAPTGCLRASDLTGGTRLTLSYRAMVSTTGILTRGSVSGPVSAEALACLQGRLERVRLRGPIPDAPLAVQTTLIIERNDPVEEAAPPETAPPPPPPGQIIQGPTGQPISGAAGAQPISGAAGAQTITGAPPAQPISGAAGAQPIQGPSGVAIGQ